jgi:hypothetical protein
MSRVAHLAASRPSQFPQDLGLLLDGPWARPNNQVEDASLSSSESIDPCCPATWLCSVQRSVAPECLDDHPGILHLQRRTLSLAKTNQASDGPPKQRADDMLSCCTCVQVRPAVRVPEQHPGVDDQRRGRGDRGRLRGGLPGVRVEPADAAADAGPGVGGGRGVRCRGAGVPAGAAGGGAQAPLRHRRHRLLHLHVRLAALHHGTRASSSSFL